MAVTEYERHQLFAWFEGQLGPERAATMMNLLPPVSGDDIATKDDLAALEARLDLRFEQRIGQLQRTFGTWLFASQAAVIAALGLLLGLAH